MFIFMGSLMIIFPKEFTMKRRTIAVCVTGFNWEYESRVVSGLYERCIELDINLLAFAPLMHKLDLNIGKSLPESFIKGETEIFNLINCDIIDGIAVLGDSIISENALYSIAEKARVHNIPIVNINDPQHPLEHNVFLSDKNAMEFVIRHIIEKHGITKIGFIGGFPDNLQTEERLAAYKKVLTEHNIPINEDYITYGHFWKDAVKCAEQLLSLDDKPRAIACASDTMALFVMDYLKENGYKLPKDMVVTGFDGIKDCDVYFPTLTSVRRDFRKAGIDAVNIINKVWTEGTAPENVYTESELLINQSCGCVPLDVPTSDYYGAKYGEMNVFKEFNNYIIRMNTMFAGSESSSQLFDSTLEGAGFFKLKQLFICICSDTESRSSAPDDKNYVKKFGLTDSMISVVKFGHTVENGTHFPTSQLIPEKDFLYGEKPVFFAFSPLYFKNNFLGYIAYEPSKIEGYGDLFETWAMSIANNAGSFYMNKELSHIADKLEMLYIADPLTGLFNRRGMEKYGIMLTNDAMRTDDTVTVICADIDNLKPINDIFGHEAGDNAIKQTAYALKASVPASGVCVRTGGDEFTVILKGIDIRQVEGFISAAEKRLTDYNSTSGLPYKIGCSCGFYSEKASKMGSLDRIAKLADAEMYKIKTLKKTNRT